MNYPILNTNWFSTNQYTGGCQLVIIIWQHYLNDTLLGKHNRKVCIKTGQIRIKNFVTSNDFLSISELCRKFGFSSWVGLGWSFGPYYSYLITSKEICKSETFYVMLYGIINYRVIVNFMHRILLQLWFFVHSTKHTCQYQTS